jgi:hypothetical protein
MKTKSSLLALAALLFIGLPLQASSGAVAVSVSIAPPVIPIYEQPYCPGPGYIWVPGYWAYGAYGYYWVPGTWVLPPGVGLLWTPGYWAYRGGNYVFIDGYWGTSIGYYGGINYGHGYFGNGYYGGRWSGNTFLYNTAVTRVRPSIKNVYTNREALKFKGNNRAGFNGPGGVQAKPSSRELAAARGKHIKPTSAQRARAEAAKNDPGLRAKNNKGKPKVEAVRAVQNQTHERAGAAAGNKGEATGKRANQRAESENARRTNANEHNRAEKPTNRAAKAANQPRHEVKQQRQHQVAPRHARDVQPVHRRVEPRKVQSAPHITRHAPPAPRRAPVMRNRPAPGHGQNGPAQGPEKKKKRNKERPGGG